MAHREGPPTELDNTRGRPGRPSTPLTEPLSTVRVHIQRHDVGKLLAARRVVVNVCRRRFALSVGVIHLGPHRGVPNVERPAWCLSAGLLVPHADVRSQWHCARGSNKRATTHQPSIVVRRRPTHYHSRSADWPTLLLTTRIDCWHSARRTATITRSRIANAATLRYRLGIQMSDLRSHPIITCDLFRKVG